MIGNFFTVAAKAVTAFVLAFAAALWSAAQAGTVFGPRGINWDTIATALAGAFVTTIGVYFVRNRARRAVVGDRT